MSENKIIITKEEQKWIASLKRLAKKCPKSLLLFSWSNSFVVFKEVNGKDATIDSISGIRNDGGDPNYGEEVWWEEDVNIIFE